MRSKKHLNLFLLLVSAIIIGILIKNNVTAVKEETTQNLGNSTLSLDINSELVQNLYQNLNIKLINNSCKLDDGCINNSNYNLLYFKIENSTKVLTDDEMLYLIFNSIYQEGTYTEITHEENAFKIKIELDVVQDKLKKMYNIDTFESFESILRPAEECGIVEFLYTGTHYELTINECNKEDSFGRSKLVSAIKEDNYIYLNIQSFYGELKKENYYFYDYSKDDYIVKKSIDDLASLDTIFEDFDITTFSFKFELIGDNYLLKDVVKI